MHVEQGRLARDYRFARLIEYGSYQRMGSAVDVGQSHIGIGAIVDDVVVHQDLQSMTRRQPGGHVNDDL